MGFLSLIVLSVRESGVLKLISLKNIPVDVRTSHSKYTHMAVRYDQKSSLIPITRSEVTDVMQSTNRGEVIHKYAKPFSRVEIALFWWI